MQPRSQAEAHTANDGVGGLNSGPRSLVVPIFRLHISKQTDKPMSFKQSSNVAEKHSLHCLNLEDATGGADNPQPLIHCVTVSYFMEFSCNSCQPIKLGNITGGGHIYLLFSCSGHQTPLKSVRHV